MMTEYFGMLIAGKSNQNARVEGGPRGTRTISLASRDHWNPVTSIIATFNIMDRITIELMLGLGGEVEDYIAEKNQL
jgi:hypothetical protein